MKSIRELLGCRNRAGCRTDSREPPSWYNQGVEMMTGARFEEAVGCFDRSLEENPRDVRSWNNKGISLLSLGRFEGALHCLEKAIDLDPSNAFYWYNKGICQERLGRLDEAIAAYDKAVELYPKYAEALFNRAAALEAKGDVAAAIEAWRKYLQVAANRRGQREWTEKALERLAKLKGGAFHPTFAGKNQTACRFAFSGLSEGKGKSIHQPVPVRLAGSVPRERGVRGAARGLERELRASRQPRKKNNSDKCGRLARER